MRGLCNSKTTMQRIKSGLPLLRSLAQALTHVSETGKVRPIFIELTGLQPCMVDVGDKIETLRVAHARSFVFIPPAVADLFSPEEHEIVGTKGAVFSTAIVCGTQMAKKTSDMIPFCHNIPLDSVEFDVDLVSDSQIQIDCKCRTFGKTGVEMEALTGASAAALCVYDMLKAVSKDIWFETRLISKTGGKSSS